MHPARGGLTYPASATTTDSAEPLPGRGAARGPVDHQQAEDLLSTRRPDQLALATRGEDDDLCLVDALVAGDEGAFARLLERYHGSLVRLATAYVDDRAVAEEVAQETWIGVLQGIRGFERRSAFKTWLFSILVNQARRRGKRERRCVPFSALGDGDDAPAVPPERFLPAGDEWAGWWATYPERWAATPEELMLAGEVRGLIERAIAELTPSQRQVVTLRDVEGWSADEVCGLLGLTAANQRVLLHRGRSRVRAALERYLEGSEGAA
jgi:RNA polymerase sigma-70 factor, ECF subfamily